MWHGYDRMNFDQALDVVEEEFDPEFDIEIKKICEKLSYIYMKNGEPAIARHFELVALFIGVSQRSGIYKQRVFRKLFGLARKLINVPVIFIEDYQYLAYLTKQVIPDYYEFINEIQEPSHLVPLGVGKAGLLDGDWRL